MCWPGPQHSLRAPVQRCFAPMVQSPLWSSPPVEVHALAAAPRPTRGRSPAHTRPARGCCSAAIRGQAAASVSSRLAAQAGPGLIRGRARRFWTQLPVLCPAHVGLEALALRRLDLAPLIDGQPHRAAEHVDLGVAERDVGAGGGDISCGSGIARQKGGRGGARAELVGRSRGGAHPARCAR